MFYESDRRRFLKFAAASSAASAFANSLPALGQVSAAETKLDPNVVRFSDDIEPLVRLLEDTDHNSLMEELARRIK
ncbi:MAG: twin-arginine translocation signal domain-containing protein, partial [Planctomycetales bacterium]|nr:twin-arginine translocation signal domain-containing protein [Planctomycetales bacterium]